MASTSTTASVPSSGTYPVHLASSLFPSAAKKRKRDDVQLVALKYTFKPASMNNVTDAAVVTTESGTKILRANTSSHGTQAFDIREEQSKARECVLVYDPVTSSFTLHALPTTAHLTLNRSGAAPIRGSTAHSETSSTTSSSSQPLAQRQSGHAGLKGDRAAESGDEIEVAPRQPPKRRRPSEMPTPDPAPQARPRPTTGGKGLPRKTAPAPAAHAAIPDFSAPAKAKPKKAAGVKKGTKGVAAGKKKAPAVQQGKFKSAEIIEDSEEEYDLGTSEVGGQADANRDDGGGEEDEDDFAKMLGESLAEDADGAGEEDDDDEEEEEDDEEYEDELEGARFAPRQSKNSSAINDEAEEWL